MKKPKSNVQDLLAAIKRTPSPSSAPSKNQALEAISEAEPVAEKKVKNPAQEKKTKNRVGKPVQFWMHDEERNLVRELSAWVAGQGIRPTDSMIIRAALRFAKTGNAFLEAYREAALLDGRLKQN
jgi:hypothetical protein